MTAAVKKTQQEPLYAAEATAPRGRQFDSLDAIQRFVDDLRDTRWWHTQGFWTVLRIEVGKPGARKTSSVGWFDKPTNAGRIEMLDCHWNELIVLHEVAHVLASALHGSKSHDPYFARIYLVLVSCVMGADAYLTLQRSFDAHDINYHVDPPSSGVAL